MRHHHPYAHLFHAHVAECFFGRHHRGFMGFGFGHPGMRGDAGRGPGGLGAGRKLGSADLQLLILALLAEKPRHGYELIKAIDERSNGYYSPSPGMVYPALTYLEELGHADVALDGTKKRYTITSEGLAFVETNRAAVDALFEQLAWIGQRMDHVRRAFRGDEASEADEDFDAPQGRRGGRGRGRDADDFVDAVRQARRSLKSALIAKFGAGEDEQKRIAEILERAAKEIRGES